ncbi:hypothetical protein [Halorussus halobius]|uniref:hypothetical protein n=1 Tax=Halorussus halobius TaxID=1710537 RepID=UPI00109281C9|nr:hypothetical protein [Halorussus halobius]
MDEGASAGENGPLVLESRLTGAVSTLYRIAFGFLSGGPLVWFLLFVCLPLSVLAGAVVVGPELASLAVGLPALFLLGFWWSSYRYASPRVTVDATRRTIRIEHGRTPAWTRAKTVDVDDLRSVFVVPLGGFALVRLDYRERNVFEPWDFLVPRADLPAVDRVLTGSGVDVRRVGGRDASRWRRFEPVVRVVVTPLVLVAVPTYAVREFGTGAFDDNVVVVAGIVAAWTLQAQVTAAVGLRPERRSLAVVLDVVGTVAVVVGAVWLYVKLT